MFKKSTFAGSKWALLVGLVLILSGLSSVVSPIARAGNGPTVKTCPIRLEAIEQQSKVSLSVKIKTHMEEFFGGSDMFKNEYTTPKDIKAVSGLYLMAEPSSLTVQHNNTTKHFQGWVICRGTDCKIYVYKPNTGENREALVFNTCESDNPPTTTLRAIYGPLLSNGRVTLTIAAGRQNDVATDISVKIVTNYGDVTTKAVLTLLKWTKFEATAPQSVTIPGFGEKQFLGWEICAGGICIIDTMSGRNLVVPYNQMTVNGSIRAIYGATVGSTVALKIGAGVLVVDMYGQQSITLIAGVQITTNYGTITSQASLNQTSLQVLKWIGFTAMAPASVQYAGSPRRLLGWSECTQTSLVDFQCSMPSTVEKLQVQRVEQSTNYVAVYQ